MATTMQIVNPISPNNSISITISYPNPQFTTSHLRKSTITFAKPTRKAFLTSHRSRKTLISLVRFAASNLHHVLPAPFNSVIRELNIAAGDDGGGSGGGSGGSWNRFRWGGFDGGGGGRKRKPNKKSQFWFWGFITVCCLGLGFWLISGGDIQLELNNNAVLAAMCLTMFIVLIRNGLVPEWLLGFCGGGVFVGLLLNKKHQLQKLVKGLQTSRRRHMRIK